MQKAQKKQKNKTKKHTKNISHGAQSFVHLTKPTKQCCLTISNKYAVHSNNKSTSLLITFCFLLVYHVY